MCTDAYILEKTDSGYPWGVEEEEHERLLAELVSTCGDVDRMPVVGAGDQPGDAPREDPAFVSWYAKFARFSATPTSYEAFDRMWYETDVRDALGAVHAPAAVLYKRDGRGWGDRDNATKRGSTTTMRRWRRSPGSSFAVGCAHSRIIPASRSSDSASRRSVMLSHTRCR